MSCFPTKTQPNPKQKTFNDDFPCCFPPRRKTPKGGDRLSFAPHIPLLSRWSPRPRFFRRSLLWVFVGYVVTFFCLDPPQKKRSVIKMARVWMGFQVFLCWKDFCWRYKNESCGYSYGSLDSWNDDVDIFVLLQHLQFCVEFLLELVLFLHPPFWDVRLSVWSWICPV